MMQGKKLRPATAIIVIVIAGSFFVNHFLFNSSKKNIQAELEKAVEELNKKCPVMTDEGTRCDNAEIPAPLTFQYNFTLINIQDKSEADTNDFKTNVFPSILKEFKASPKTKLFRDDNITVISNYRDIKGNFIFKSTIRPEDYK